MDFEKRKILEAAGWRFGDAADFLGMTDAERQLLDARVEAALAVRHQREALKLSQKELARRIKTSQPRIFSGCSIHVGELATWRVGELVNSRLPRLRIARGDSPILQLANFK